MTKLNIKLKFIINIELDLKLKIIKINKSKILLIK